MELAPALVCECNFVKKLWGTETQDLTVKDFNGLRELLAFLDQDPSWDEFARRYGEVLHSIPEDRWAPFTSLHNHLRLAGMVTRLLELSVRLEKADGRLVAVYRGATAESVDEVHGRKKPDLVGKWKVSLIKAWVNFPHYIVRLQDLHILRERRRALELLAERYPDNALYFTEDFALLLFSEFRPEIVEGLGDFQWRFRIMESDLTIMSSDLDRPGKFNGEVEHQHGARVHEMRWPQHMPETMQGTLYPVYQKDPGTTKWAKGGLEEVLCRE